MSLRKRGNFLNLLQNEGVPRKYPENPPFSEGGSLRKKGGGGGPTLEETMEYHSQIIEFFRFAKLQFRIKEKIYTKGVHSSK